MRHELLKAARQIAGDVRTSENDYDLALANNARLLASLLDARRNAGLPARTGREALERAVQAISHGAEARKMLIEMHDELAGLNLRVLAVGDMTECPDALTTGLSIVPAADGRQAA